MIGGYVYVMRSNPLGRSKIGITTNPKARERNVDETTAGDVRIAVCFWFIAPRFVERTLHRLLRVFRTRRKGSGGTEWFWLPSVITAPLLWGVWVFQLLTIGALAVFLAAVLFHKGDTIAAIHTTYEQFIHLVKIAQSGDF